LRKKFIEEEFPIIEISKFGVNEKNNNFGNISTIHPWWARRPTSVVRALILSCLFDYPEEDIRRKEIVEYIIKASSDFKKLPNDLGFKQILKNLIINKKSREKIRLLDPFAGGGAIPLEAIRLGLETYCSDLNPVAVLIEKATCEYFQKFNGKLIQSLNKWWKILNKSFIKEIEPFYKNPINNNKIIGYFWARQIKCSNSNCNALIPMISNCVLVKKTKQSGKKKIKKLIVLKPVISGKIREKKINFILQKDENIDFNYSNLKIFSDGKVTCPACGITIDNYEVMEKVRNENYEDRLLIVFEKNNNGKKEYRLATKEDIEIYENAARELKKYEKLIPKEELPEKVIKWRIQNYGIFKWSDFFNKRQLLISIIYCQKLNKLFKKIINNNEDNSEFYSAIKLFLSFYLSKLINYNSKFTYWDKRESIAKTWTRSGIFMRGAYPENNPIHNSSAKMENYFYYLNLVVDNIGKISDFAKISQADARNLEYESNFFDLIITDPPYYDAMLYANPSDFFYIWLKKCLEDSYPELFLLDLTPKDEEIIQNRFRYNGDKKEAIKFYEYSLKSVLKEFYRILKPNGIGIIMYTHKSVVAWEILIKALLESKFTISAAWPIATETKGGVRSLNRVVLASSISIVFKKIKKEKKIYFETQFSKILEEELREKLKHLLIDLGIYGADFFISAIGFSLSIFTRYEAVISQKTGQIISISDFLDLVRKLVNDFLLETVLERKVATAIDKISNLYIIWCWFFRNNGIDLDDALKLAQSFGVGELNDLRRKKIIKLEDKKYKLLLASDKERENYLLKNKENLDTLIEKLHLSAIMWKNNDKDLNEFINKFELEYGENIWKVGQALAEFFPNNHKEHNYLQGLLAKFGKTKSKSNLNKWLK